MNLVSVHLKASVTERQTQSQGDNADMHAHTHTHTIRFSISAGAVMSPLFSLPSFPQLFFLCSPTAHRHVQVLPLGSLAWQEACFQSFALFFPSSSSPFSFLGFFLPPSVPVLANYRHILLLPTACCCCRAPPRHPPSQPAPPPPPPTSVSPFLLTRRERREEVEGSAGVQMCINEAVKGRG